MAQPAADRRRRPRVLFVTGHLPFPPVSGGRRRELELLSRLSHDFEFHMMVSSKTFNEDVANLGAVRHLCASVGVWPAGAGEPPRAQGRVPHLVRQAWSPELAAAVEAVLRERRVDVVHVERFHLLQHVPGWARSPILLVEQNIEYTLWGQRVSLARDRRERKRRFGEYVTTLQAEIEAWRRAAICGAVTEEDREVMLAAVPGLDVRIIAHGIDPMVPLPSPRALHRPLPGVDPSGRGLVVFLANFGYGPNADAALFLCREIHPRVRASGHPATLVLVGNDPPPEVQAFRAPDVVVTGRVPAVEPYLDAADVVVCPLREGGGIKVKVLEALARGRAVVSTTVGAQGFGPGARTAMRIEDRPRRFAQAVVDLLEDPAERARLGAAGRRLVEGLPTWDDSAAALAAAYRELVVASRTSVTGAR